MSYATAPLGSLAKIINGGTPDTQNPNYWGGGIAWLTPKDMGRANTIAIRTTSRTISEAGVRNSSAQKVPAGSVILSTRAPIGHLAINTVEMAFNQGCRGLVPGPRLKGKFLFYFLRANVPLLDDLGTGTTFKELSAGALSRVSVPVPSVREQERIVAVLDEACEAIATATANTSANVNRAHALFHQRLDKIFRKPPPNWTKKPIGDCVVFVDYRGKTPPKAATGVRLITAKNVKMGFIQRNPEEFVEDAAYESWMTRGFPQRGDVLFTTEAPLGNVAQLDTDESVVIGQRLITMKPKRDVLDSTFLSYALRSGPLQQAIQSHRTGATVAGIKASLLKRIEIAYPSLNEQVRINAQLAALANRVAELESIANKKLALIAELKASLLFRAFSGELTGAQAVAA